MTFGLTDMKSESGTGCACRYGLLGPYAWHSHKC